MRSTGLFTASHGGNFINLSSGVDTPPTAPANYSGVFLSGSLASGNGLVSAGDSGCIFSKNGGGLSGAFVLGPKTAGVAAGLRIDANGNVRVEGNAAYKRYIEYTSNFLTLRRSTNAAQGHENAIIHVSNNSVISNVYIPDGSIVTFPVGVQFTVINNNAINAALVKMATVTMAQVLSVQSSNQFTCNLNHALAGSITFNAGSLTGLVATLVAGVATVTLTTGTTTGLVDGNAITKTAGTGVFGFLEAAGTDTLQLAAGATGTRSLAPKGVAHFLKTEAAKWYCWGDGLT